ncbi:MAG: hypothetical protein ACE14S_11195 [Candidatus Bathyarchaeia archaeon]
MGLAGKQVNWLLFAVEGIGAVFVSVFLSVYLLGLRDVPKDVVYHSDPAFRAVLSVFGVLLVAILLIGAVATMLSRKKVSVPA